MPNSDSFTLPLDCHYRTRVPEGRDPDLAVLALHGYGMSAETMMRLVTPTLEGVPAVIASLQGPHQHYRGEGPSSGIAAYNWGIRQHHGEAVRLHREMVRHVVAAMGQRFGIPPKRCVLLGFSQPVGLNYRFVGAYPEEIGGVIGICGGVPKDWDEEPSPYRDFATPILHIARDQDEFFPVEAVSQFARRLSRHASDVEFHLIPGAHRYPSSAGDLVRPWLKRFIPRS
jgi:predicted esterase